MTQAYPRARALVSEANGVSAESPGVGALLSESLSVQAVAAPRLEVGTHLPHP
eukprot:CAMPEP_0183363390 /NCGR_PEP_ID=MMETSP0164_2-20130417/74973_1 /TAXON_ID=221442 /ORGANISM="Coccolithus pelagicus ssp braarudi, Strain PLY182g" /LENGTH=52 /DNA_ID=CAMNT_0025538479 /DNA_START=57 /DNA_END=215 /DNA_ORIENTATION=-